MGVSLKEGGDVIEFEFVAEVGVNGTDENDGKFFALGDVGENFSCCCCSSSDDDVDGL